MPKIKTPLFSFNATGPIGKLLSFTSRFRKPVLQTRPSIPDAKTAPQLSWRAMFQLAISLWHALSPAEQFQWETEARPYHMSGYAWFMSQALRPNPGIYLPLAGGTMSGNIDMDSNRILNLIAPTVDLEPATKKYVDDAPGGGILPSIFDAHSIIMAILDNTPIVLTVAEQTLIGRITGGNVTDLTIAEVKTLLGVGAASGIASLDAGSVVAQTPKTHGPGQHTDLTRTLFYPVTNVSATGTPGNYNGHPVISLPTGSTTNVFIEFHTPLQFVSFTSLEVIWTGDTGGTAGQDWRNWSTAKYGAPGEASNTHADTPAAVQFDVTALDTLYATDLGLTLANLAAADYIGVLIRRVGGHGSDTYLSNIKIHGILLTYIAEE